MSKKDEKKALDLTTEDRIKAAARSVFHEKGFAAARTRDIAEAAGINLALLNYYFRSKEKLFEQIMMETMSAFMHGMVQTFNDETTTLEEKIELVTGRYIDLISTEPNVPLFILSELRQDANGFLKKIPFAQVVAQSVFMRQYVQFLEARGGKGPSPLHFLSNLVGLIVFPFIASPVLKKIGGLDDDQFRAMIAERRRLIPIWIKSMLEGA